MAIYLVEYTNQAAPDLQKLVALHLSEATRDNILNGLTGLNNCPYARCLVLFAKGRRWRRPCRPAGRAQQPERMRRIGVLLSAAADDAEFQVWVGAFLQGLALLGWALGRNMRIDTRWAGTNPADIRNHATELAALEPEVILALR